MCYKPSNPALIDLWNALLKQAEQLPAANLIFVGPSGSGKTEGARYLANIAGLDFTKVDAASMTDPEAWFGTRELVVEQGVSVTRYQPSLFIEAVQRPGVVLIDEINRIRDSDRNILIPILDHTREVLNPLTGTIVKRHQRCFIIMSANVGLAFTGTNAIDPAFMNRALTIEFTYLDPEQETAVAVEASGADRQDVARLVRFANETREKAAQDADFYVVSTRSVIEASRLIAAGLSTDLAVEFVIFNAASNEGGRHSMRQQLKNIWAGVRTWTPESSENNANATKK
jgi:MoxR-like ATPase